MKLRLDRFTCTEQKEIESGDTIHLFANKVPRDEHNIEKLAGLVKDNNPLAVIKGVLKPIKGKKRGNMAHFPDDRIRDTTLLCRGAKVCISGCNFAPQWGLFNGAMGTVQDIFFDKDKDPNNGDHPLYIAVEFPQYKGPAWTESNHKVVPIPMISTICEHYCCKLIHCPLDLSFGRTIHTFQGQSAGEVEQGKPPNTIKTIIADPGPRAMEGQNPGLFYTLTSRGTTIGDDKGYKSAIYFIGPNMNPSRITSLQYKTGGTKYKKIQERETWVLRLEQNTINAP